MNSTFDPGWFVNATEPSDNGAGAAAAQQPTFKDNGLTYFRLNFTDPDNDAIGFGFRTIFGAEQHLFTNLSSGRISNEQVEYPFNLPSGSLLDVHAYIYDAAGDRSPEALFHLVG